MGNKSNLGKELLGLGKDLAEAVRAMKSSKELKSLEKDITGAVKSISKSMWTSLQAARKSPETKKIQQRLGRVLKEGKKQGAIELERAKATAAKGIQKARTALKKIKKENSSSQNNP